MLAVRHDRDNLDYLELRHRIGFINPVPVARMRRRAVIKKMLEMDPGHVYANTERARQDALIYFNHKDRIKATSSTAPVNIIANTPRQVTEGEGVIGDQQAPGAIQIQDPFNIEQVKSQGFEFVDVSELAEKALPRALFHARRALRTAPANPEATELLMGLYAFSEEHEPMLARAKQSVQHDPENAYFNLYLGYAAYKMSEMDLAYSSFARGIALLDEADRSVFLDVERVMNKQQIRATPSEVFAQDAFWQNQDPLLLTEQNERELEHYARLVYADLLFGEPKLDRRGWDSERGEIYVRYGRPQAMFYYTGSVENCDLSGIGNQSNFHIFDYGTYKFVFSSPGSSIGTNGTGAAVLTIPTLNDFILYSPCAAMFGQRNTGASALDYVIFARSHIKKMPTDFQLGGNVVQFPHLTTQLRDATNQPQVLVTYGFPVLMEEARNKSPGSTTRLGLNTGAFLVNDEGPAAQQTRQVDNVYTEEILLFEGAALWPGTHLLEAEPGAYRLSVEFTRASDNAIGAAHEELVVAAPDARFAMSDILLAYFIEEGEGGPQQTVPSGTFIRDTYEIQPAPWGLYENGQPVYLYVELYNLPLSPDGSANYTVEAAIIDRKQADKRTKGLFRRARRNGQGVSVRFASQANAPTAREYFIMETESIDPGNYVLIVQVTDKATGEKVEQRRDLFLK